MEMILIIIIAILLIYNKKPKNSKHNSSNKKTVPFRKAAKSSPTKYETGWTWNEEKQLWEPPESEESDSNSEKQEEKKQGSESAETDLTKGYQARSIFSRNEWQSYKKLRDIAEVKGYIICPKVRLLDIIEPKRGEEKYKTRLYKIQSKHVDFVICDQNMTVKAIIELDDNSHDRSDRHERDEFVDKVLRNSGYKVIHTRYIENDILDLV